MKKTTRRVLLAGLIAVFLVSGGMMLRQLGDYQQGDETYGSAESLAGLPDFSATVSYTHLTLPTKQRV